jgi:hypothetical protein
MKYNDMKKRPTFENAIVDKIPINSIKINLFCDQYEMFTDWLDNNGLNDIHVVIYTRYNNIIRSMSYELYYTKTNSETLLYYLLKNGTLEDAYLS